MAERFEGGTVIITGGAQGIGRAAAKAFAHRGADLVICDIDEEGLEQVSAEVERLGVEVFARVVDVADREAMAAFAEEVQAEIGAADVLINNAGVGLYGGILHTDLDDWSWVVSVNLWGVIHGCHYFVPPMVEAGRGGHVLNVASLAGLVAAEKLGAYSTTKFAVVGLSEALREELAPHGIGVTAICPGFIQTNIVESTRLKGHSEIEDHELERHREKMRDFFRRRASKPETVADAMLDAIEQNPAVRPVTAEAWTFYLSKRLAPGMVDWGKRKLAELFNG